MDEAASERQTLTDRGLPTTDMLCGLCQGSGRVTLGQIVAVNRARARK